MNSDSRINPHLNELQNPHQFFQNNNLSDENVKIKTNKVASEVTQNFKANTHKLTITRAQRKVVRRIESKILKETYEQNLGYRNFSRDPNVPLHRSRNRGSKNPLNNSSRQLQFIPFNANNDIHPAPPLSNLSPTKVQKIDDHQTSVNNHNHSNYPDSVTKPDQNGPLPGFEEFLKNLNPNVNYLNINKNH